MAKRLRVLYIEDLKVVREAVNYLLAQYPHLEVIDDGFKPDQVIDFIGKNNINIVILDLQLSLPPESETLNGFDICQEITRYQPKTKVIANSLYDNIESVNRFFQSGGHGFVSKKSGHKELLDAIEAVKNGERYLCEVVTASSKNAEKFLAGEDFLLKGKTELFTKTEKAILEKIAKGFSTKQIAHQLDISEKTVETHRKHLFDKAGVKNVAELIAFVFSRRIVME